MARAVKCLSRKQWICGSNLGGSIIDIAFWQAHYFCRENLLLSINIKLQKVLFLR